MDVVGMLISFDVDDYGLTPMTEGELMDKNHFMTTHTDKSKKQQEEKKVDPEAQAREAAARTKARNWVHKKNGEYEQPEIADAQVLLTYTQIQDPADPEAYAHVRVDQQ